MRESALLKTLGAGRAQIGRVLITEYFALGALAGLTGVLLSIIAGWLLVRFFFEFDFSVPVGSMAVLWLGVALITVVIGVLNSRDVMNRAPLAVLREATD
jgi:putative ABC transport system permease protein